MLDCILAPEAGRPFELGVWLHDSLSEARLADPGLARDQHHATVAPLLWPPPHRTVEEYRGTALDVRELYRHHVFDCLVGSVWCNCALTWPWLRSFRLGSACLELELRNGWRLTVPLVWRECGVFNRTWLACPVCRRTVCLLYGTNQAKRDTVRYTELSPTRFKNLWRD